MITAHQKLPEFRSSHCCSEFSAVLMFEAISMETLVIAIPFRSCWLTSLRKWSPIIIIYNRRTPECSRPRFMFPKLQTVSIPPKFNARNAEGYVIKISQLVIGDWISNLLAELHIPILDKYSVFAFFVVKIPIHANLIPIDSSWRVFTISRRGAIECTSAYFIISLVVEFVISLMLTSTEYSTVSLL